MSRNKFNSATNFLNSDRVLESQSLRNQNKKYISIFGPDNIINSDIKRSKILLSKNQNIIKNYDKTFIMIEKLNDNKSYFALKRELNNEMKKNQKKKKFVGNEFSKHHLNLKNFKYLINEQHDKQNDDEKFMYNFMNHLENRKKPKKKIRYSQIFDNLSKNSRNLKRRSIISPLKENYTHTNILSNNTLFSFNSTTANETNENFFNKNKIKKNKDKYPLFYKSLNKKLLNILNIAKNKENLIEISDKKLKDDIKYNKTENNFYNKFTDKNKTKLEQKNLYFKDNSKFNYPIINKKLYQEMGKIDFFEKTKIGFVDEYLKKKELMKLFLIEKERERKEMEEYLKEKEE